MKVTRAMVAKKAGVSVSTVSYVLNSSRYVSPKLTQKVMAAVESLDYSPDMAARSMVTKRSQILTIVANDLSNTMYGEIVMAIEREAVKCGYFINIFSGQFPLGEYIKFMIARRVDGMFFSSVPDKATKEDIQKLLSNDIAIASGNYLFAEEKNIVRVDVDYKSGIKQAVDHLVGLGHKNIAYLNGLKEGKSEAKQEGFVEFMQEKGLDPSRIVYGFGENSLTEKEGKILTDEILKKFPDTTAIICYSDTMAYGVLQQLHALGYKVPDDFSVVGIENLVTSNFTNPPLTSLAFDRDEFAREVVNALIKKIEKDEHSESYVKMRLYVRESTAKPKK